MIYVLEKDNLVYLSEKPRQEDKKNGGYTEELVYTFEGIELTETIKNKLRPWYCFWEKDKECYRLDILQHIDSILETISGCKKNVELSESEKIKYLKEYIDAFNFLGIESKEKLDKTGIKYFCDIINILSVEYGMFEMELVRNYIKLSDYDKNFLRTLKLYSSKNKQLEYCRSYRGDIELLFPFLPDFIIDDYLIFNSSIKDKNTRKIHPFLDTDPLENTDKLEKLKKMIYSEFNLGDYYSGQQIKLKLEEIYKSIDFHQTPKILDLYNYFDITKSNINKISSYRLDTRKII